MDQLLLVLQETQYTQMKQRLYKKLFKELIKFFMLVPIVEIARSLISANLKVFSASIGMALMGAAMLGFVSRMKKHQDIAITTLIIFLYTVVISSNYYLQTSLFSNVHDSFHFGCLTIGFGAALANRVPKFSHRVLFNVLLVVIRLVIVPVEDVSTLPGELILLCFGIYLDFDREKNDQKLFGSHFYSKEQLTRFKDLVVNDIPDSLIIVNHELSSCLFANNAFTKLWDDTENSPTHISACLNKLFIMEGLNEISFHSASYPLDNRQTLLQFLQQTFFSNNEISLNKASCNVSYIKSNNSRKHNSSFEHIQNPTELSFEVKILSLVWDQKPAFGIILHDITQQNTNLRLKVAANVQKDRILATVSHELRTPLNSILGMVQIMQQKTQDSEMQRYLKICSSSGYLLLGLVNSILDLNMIKANKLKLNIEELDIREILQDILRLFEYQCAHKKIYLKLKVSSLIPKIVSTDKNRLSQILINLIGNALKFTVNGGIKVSLGPSLSSPQSIFVSVEDTGIGIKEEDKGKLFRMFGKLDQNHKGTVVNNQGVGLGLTISDAIAKLLCNNNDMAGIKVESNYDKGSKFSFLIDKKLNVEGESTIENNETSQSLTSVDEGEMESKTLDSYQNTFTPGKKTRHFDFNIPEVSKSSFSRSQLVSKTPENRTPFMSPSLKLKLERRPNSYGKQAPCILVVDDNPLNFTVVEFFIKRLGFQAKMALSGESAIQIVKENDWDVEEIKMILMDLQMPIMDGYHTTRKLRGMMEKKKIPEIPIVALSANDSENDKRMCMDTGMVDYLSKPLKDEELKMVIKKYVDV